MRDAKENLIKQLEDFAPSSAADVAAAAPYLRFKSFDSQGIRKLAKVTGFCKPFQLKGSFISDSGHETRVTLSVVPGSEPSSQSLRVKFIARTFAGRYTNEQMDELSKQLEARYHSVNQGNGFNFETVPTWRFVGNTLELYSASDALDQGDQLRQYPGCVSSLKID
jgi:hypothetical protein